MKPVLLAALAIGMPLLLMLFIGQGEDPPVDSPRTVVSPPERQPVPRTVPGPAVNDIRRRLQFLPDPSPRDADDRRPEPSAAGTGSASTTGAASTNPAESNNTPAAVPTTRPAAGSVDFKAWTERLDDWRDIWQERARPAPDSPRGAAVAALQSGAYERAARAFDRLLTQSPDDRDLLLGEAAALAGLGRHDDALPLLERAIELEPAQAAARYARAVTLARLGRIDEALGAFAELLDRQPDHWPARFALGILQQATGRKLEALTTWRKFSEAPAATGPAEPGVRARLDPALQLEALFHHGEVAMALQQYAEAEACFAEIAHRQPDDARGWCNLGIARAARHQDAGAISALNEALARNPRLVPALNQLAFIHAALYRDHHAPADYEALVSACDRSLAVQSYQPNIRALKLAAFQAAQSRPAVFPEKNP